MTVDDPTRQQIAGLILAGGRGRRYGGRDKGLALWQGRALIQHTIDRLAPQVTSLAISCNRNREAYARLAASVVTDKRGGFQGPLAGIESYAPLLKGDYLAVVPCDTPLLPQDMVSRLLDGLGETGARTAVAYASDGSREHYLCALIRATALPGLTSYLASGQRSVRGWFASIEAVPVDFADQPQAFKNINSKEKDPGAA